MEQTTLNSFYPTKKSSGCLPPAKRQKLETVAPVRRTRTLRHRTSKASKSVTQEKPTQLVLQSVELEKRSEERRKVSRNARHLTQNESLETDIQSTSEASNQVAESSKLANLPGLPQAPWISEQAKLILNSKKTENAKRIRVKAVPSQSLRSDRAAPLAEDKRGSQSIPTTPTKQYAASINTRGDLSSLANVKGNKEASSASSSSAVPAHVRYASLVTKPAKPTLVLPKKYKLLLDQFRCADSVLYLLQQRSEVCTFERLKQSVQQMSGRNFSIDHLAMMLTVYPKSFNLQYEKGLRNLDGNKQKSPQMTIESRFDDVLSKATSAKGKKYVPSSVLLTRKDHFQSRLVTIVKQHHKAFLDELGMSVPDEKLYRWHPKFEVDKLPNVEKAQLPDSPSTTKYSTANDILNDNRVQVNSRIKEALETIAKKSNHVTEKDVQKESTINDVKPAKKMMTGVSNDLLERIRQKEKVKQELDMRRTPADDKHRSMVERLPDIASILKTFFTTEKKAAIPLEDCVQKLVDSYTTATSRNDLEDHIKLLAKEFPDWVSIVIVRKCPYIKLRKTTDINTILTKIKQLN